MSDSRGSAKLLGRIPAIPKSVLWVGFGLLVSLSVLSIWSFQAPYIQLGLIVLIAVPFLVANARISLLLFLTITLLLVIKGTHDNAAAGAPEILGGVGYVLVTAAAIIRSFASGEDFHDDWPQVTTFLFLIVLTAVGLYFVLLGASSLTNWYREIFILMPLWLMPHLYRRHIKFDDSLEKPILQLTLAFWMFFTLLAVLHYRENIISAVYLYETGRADVSVGSSMFLFFLSVSFLLIKRSWKWTAIWTLMLIFSIIGITISFYRTLWVASIGLLPLLLYFGNKEERKTGIKLLTVTVILVVAGGTILWFSWPTFRLLLMSYADRFLSTKNVGTDKSLVNRYIEWRFLWDHILGSPILGYGAGSTFHIFNWIRKFDQNVGYSHNGFLYILLKSGFLGLFFFFATYLGFFWKGLKLARTKVLDPSKRAIIRAVLALQISVLLYTNTVNAFADRPLLVYLGISWGFFLVCEDWVKKQAILSRGNEAEGGYE